MGILKHTTWRDNVERQFINTARNKTTSMAWTCFPYGPPVYSTASTILAGTRIQERTRSTTNELEEHSQPRPTKDGLSWEEAEVAALDRHGWRRSVAQCVQLDARWIKVEVKVTRKNKTRNCRNYYTALCGWWRGIAVTRCVESTKSLYGGPG